MYIIGRHTLFKIKVDNDKELKCKGRIAPHGNEDDEKDDLTKDCTSCPPTGLIIVESIDALFGWDIVRGDAKREFVTNRGCKEGICETYKRE